MTGDVYGISEFSKVRKFMREGDEHKLEGSELSLVRKRATSKQA